MKSKENYAHSLSHFKIHWIHCGDLRISVPPILTSEEMYLNDYPKIP